MNDSKTNNAMQTAGEENAAQTDGEQNSTVRRILAGKPVKWGIVAGLAALCGIGGYVYYQHQARYPATSDAYIHANAVNIAPLVGGQVSDVPIADQQTVAKGDLLLRIDPRPYRYALDRAEAELAAAEQKTGAETAAVRAARAVVRERRADLENAQSQLRRASDLAAGDNASQSRLDDAKAAAQNAAAALDKAEAQLVQARETLGQKGAENTQVEQAQAAANQARLDLEHTAVRASCSGRVSGFMLEQGEVMEKGEVEGVLVCDGHFWVYANYKETDITRLRPGQVATLKIDMYPEKTFHGIVESIDAASGAAFSLLPPENATGNWVKVTQRVPVRILIVDAGPDYPLSVRTSVSVSVDTGGQDKPNGLDRGTTLSDADALALAGKAHLLDDG